MKREKEWDLHERILGKEPTASVDLFLTFMDPLFRMLKRQTKCSDDDAHDSAIDALFAYLKEPDKFDPGKGSMSAYLVQIARYKAWDRYRSSSARAQREEKMRVQVEVEPPPPNVSLEEYVEMKQLVERLVRKIEALGLDDRDQACIRLIITDSRSTESWAEVLGLTHLPQDQMRQVVKRHYDRLMKRLKSLCKEDPDEES
ncbi:sigma-70 family RNA polymerase sigma factor [Corallococcus praedator]|uniref:Sigma-70 family RNA polymerase sigma factor n=1 Tax=Corallococcus praedator TaxID=2316724 RepID=A0ABX9QG89_9BACT|nr:MULTISPECIES: sigma-70 family RNA polymerase sigma factor [Corallococcus]RKH18704.1 sigma-70 family RNA polymerase sigma factor [Corallococcus sp. CA047B]RKH33771.1 sigma-70 family RNA polymerase sigma factor [Corallococcus sp. CA031C]RKI06338.1 sigma-70 family RNA polymerase sigma factor [Corallococcus praedator]